MLRDAMEQIMMTSFMILMSFQIILIKPIQMLMILKFHRLLKIILNLFRIKGKIIHHYQVSLNISVQPIMIIKNRMKKQNNNKCRIRNRLMKNNCSLNQRFWHFQLSKKNNRFKKSKM